jgi:purine nucleoside permease
MNPTPRLSSRSASSLRIAGALVASIAIAASASTVAGAPAATARSTKVLIVTPTDAEAQLWVTALGLTQTVTVPGLPTSDPAVRCNENDVCLLTTGVGKANSAAAVAAVAFTGRFDLTHAYFIVSGVADIDPAQGTLGSVAWATNVVDGAIAWELDGRSLPSGWTTGYLGIDTTDPTQKPAALFGSELYALDPGLVGKAVALAKGVTLGDDGSAQSCRASYAGAPATATPAVVACDTVTSDTLWHGELLGTHASAWASIVAGSAATYCTQQQEANAAVTALQRAAGVGLLDGKRIVVVAGASSFDRPPSTQSAFDALSMCEGAGSQPAMANLVAATSPLVSAIVSGWGQWQNGVPQ